MLVRLSKFQQGCRSGAPVAACSHPRSPWGAPQASTWGSQATAWLPPETSAQVFLFAKYVVGHRVAARPLRPVNVRQRSASWPTHGSSSTSTKPAALHRDFHRSAKCRAVSVPQLRPTRGSNDSHLSTVRKTANKAPTSAASSLTNAWQLRQ
jgi:hypothetical protein